MSWACSRHPQLMGPPAHYATKDPSSRRRSNLSVPGQGDVDLPPQEPHPSSIAVDNHNSNVDGRAVRDAACASSLNTAHGYDSRLMLCTWVTRTVKVSVTVGSRRVW